MTKIKVFRNPSNTRDMPLTVKPLTKTIGAEVTGVDLAKPLDEPTRRALYDAWIEHAVLVIRDQHLSP